MSSIQCKQLAGSLAGLSQPIGKGMVVVVAMAVMVYVCTGGLPSCVVKQAGQLQKKVVTSE
jgi:hypothetical protein